MLTQTEKAPFFFHINKNLIWSLLLSGKSWEQAVPGRNKLPGSRLMFGAGFSADFLHLSNSTFEPALIDSSSLLFPFCFNSYIPVHLHIQDKTGRVVLSCCSSELSEQVSGSQRSPAVPLLQGEERVPPHHGCDSSKGCASSLTYS